MTTLQMQNPKLQIAEGDIFDIERFGFDALALVINQRVSGRRPPLELPSSFETFKNNNPGVFMVVYGLDRKKQPILKARQVKACIWQMLDHIKTQGKRRIGVFGSQISDGTFVEGARLTFEAVGEWLKQNEADVDSITLVDKQGGYHQFLISQNV